MTDRGRRGLVAGNWKMNGLSGDAERWARAARGAAEGAPHQVAVFPPFPWLREVARWLQGSAVLLGAQACHPEPFGAYTGSVSAAMLRDCGCALVLCGHSERRRAGETDAVVAASLRRVLEEGMTPVLCVGETLEDRRGGRARQVVLAQVAAGLEALPGPRAPLVVAYEPVWAIGTGAVATPREAEEAHGWIRGRVREADPARAEGLRILYGGSVTPANIGGLLAAQDVDGALVGGASLDPEAFARIARAVPAPPSPPR